jgi:hypothetical protein
MYTDRPWIPGIRRRIFARTETVIEPFGGTETQNMSESCEILVTEWEGGQIVAGEIIFKDGKLSFSATKGYEILMGNVMEDKTFVEEKVFDPAKDPKAWLRSLPSFHTGSIVRARLVKSRDRGV